MVGLAAIFGTTVIGDLFFEASRFWWGCSTLWKRSATSYCSARFSCLPGACPDFIRNESALRESIGPLTCAASRPADSSNKVSNHGNARFKPGVFAPHSPKRVPFLEKRRQRRH